MHRTAFLQVSPSSGLQLSDVIGSPLSLPQCCSPTICKLAVVLENTWTYRESFLSNHKITVLLVLVPCSLHQGLCLGISLYELANPFRQEMTP